MNMVQESFLQWLHYQQYHERLCNYTVYDGYYNGDHEVEIPPKVKAALESELGTVNNYCRLIVDTVVDYICSGEIGIEVKPPRISSLDFQLDEASKAEAMLYEIYSDNQLLYEEIIKTVTIMGKKGDVFLKLYLDGDSIKIRVLRPEICFPRYKSDDYKEMIYCAIKWFDNEEEEPKKKWKAQVFRPDVVEYYELGEGSETHYSQWNLVSIEENILGFIPIIHIKNTIDELEFGISDLQVMTGLQDALNKTVTDMLLTMDNQAFQRVFIFGGQTPKGHKISMEPGIITEVPNESGNLQVIQAADISPFIEVMREIVDQVCTVTGIPSAALTRTGGGPISGYALRLHYIPLERKCMKKMSVLRNRLRELNKMIFHAANLLGLGNYTAFDTDIHFSGGLPIDEEAKMHIHEMELRNKIKSRRTIMQERGIENVDAEIKQIESESAKGQEPQVET
jgi:SPP1 family phage portal protein